MNERGLLRLLQTFVVSQVAYAGAFHRWTRSEEGKIDAAIRKAYRSALGLLPGTKTSALLDLGVHNTLSEISEAQRMSQLVRLSCTRTGRSILDMAGINPPKGGENSDTSDRIPLGDEEARGIIVFPMPKNVDPERDRERRLARATALARIYRHDDAAAHVDVAKYPTTANAFTVAVVRSSTGELINAASVRAKTPGQAEEAAIGLALATPGVKTILSDSKTAIRNFARSTVWEGAERIVRLGRASRDPRAHSPVTTIKWFPAHMGRLENVENRNDDADAAARELTMCRAGETQVTADPDEEATSAVLTDYGDILRRHREARREYPNPHRDLSRAETVLLRHLQVKCALTPAWARHACPELFVSAVCSVCDSELATLCHITRCGRTANTGDPARGEEAEDCVAGAGVPGDRLPEGLERCIRSDNYHQQKWAIQQLEEALARQRRTGDHTPDSPAAGPKYPCQGTPLPRVQGPV